MLVPGGRRRHSAVIATGAMHIYGGYVDLKGSTSEMWSFDFGKYSGLPQNLKMSHNVLYIFVKI